MKSPMSNDSAKKVANYSVACQFASIKPFTKQQTMVLKCKITWLAKYAYYTELQPYSV